MTALPCSHPHCCSIGYAIRTDAGEWRSLVGMIGHEELKANLDLVSNRIADQELPARLRRLLKDSLLGPAQRAGVAHPPERAPAAAQRLRPLRPGPGHPGPHRHPPRRRGPPPDPGAAGPPGQAHRGQAVHGPRHHARGAAAAVLRPRRVPGATDGGHQCAPFCAMQAWPALGRTRLSARAAATDEQAVEIGRRRPRRRAGRR